MTTGVIIGRFQVPYLHPGHLWLISTALRECEDVKILLGSNPKLQPHDPKNPYNYNQRFEMIHRIFPQIGIVPLWDEDTDEAWNIQLGHRLRIIDNPILYHSRDSFISSYTGKVPLKEIEELPGYSGTKLRNEIISG